MMRLWLAVAAAALAGLGGVGGARALAEEEAFQEITERSQRAITKGLEYLEKVQGRDGSWGTETPYPTAMTALGGLSMLGAGHTPGRGRYGRNVERAVSFLMKTQDRTGLIATQNEGGRAMHGHGFATTFLAEACGMDDDPERTDKLRRAVGKAVILTAKCQSPEGGWYYQPESRMDEGSVTVTQVQALRAARNIGVSVPQEAIDKAVSYMKRSQNPDGSIRYMLSMGGGEGRPPLTAAGVEVFYSLGMYDAPETKKALESLRRVMTGGQGTFGHDSYFRFYAAQAFYQAGGEDWRKFYPRLRDPLLNSQQSSGAWQGEGIGEVYGTALALMILELPYRYLPIFQR